MNIPKVTLDHTRAFSEEWNRHRQIALLFKDHELQFATDLANFMIATIFADIIKEQNTPKVVLA